MKQANIRSVVVSLLFLVIDVFDLLEWTNAHKNYTFALIPKTVENPFFLLSKDGCVARTRIINASGEDDNNVRCLYTGPENENDDRTQESFVSELLVNKSVDGLAISVYNVTTITPVIAQARRQGVHVVTFDSDAPDSERTAYIGTNNKFLGQQLGSLAEQLHPDGGTFVIISNTEPNIQERVEGIRQELKARRNENGGWTEAVGSPIYFYEHNTTEAFQKMHEFAQRGNVTVMIPAFALVMRENTTQWRSFVDEYRSQNLSLISADALTNQLEDLDRDYVHGLVGQRTYEMGSKAISVLYDLVVTGVSDKEIYGTNVVSHIFVPLELDPNKDQNLIGNLKYMGYVLFAVLATLSVSFAAWTIKCRKLGVVLAAQPKFLVMVAFGVLLMSGSLVPMSMEMDDDEDLLSPKSMGICMSIPWFLIIGFTFTFSALYSKTRRVNKMFHSKQFFRKITVTEREVLKPFFLLLAANVIILISWTSIDPLRYKRYDNAGTNGWNMVISSYGSCRSDRSDYVWYYLIPLGVVNLGLLVMANWQAYEARKIESEFSESRYICLSMASFLQACVSGLPILFLVYQTPEAFYIVLVFLVFIISITVLLLIFVPKIIAADKFQKYTSSEKRAVIKQAIEKSKRNSNSKNRRSGLDSTTNGDDAIGGYSGTITTSGPMSMINNNVVETFQTIKPTSPMEIVGEGNDNNSDDDS